jgi:DNA-binding SARP family transcriptional activator/tetratricopeptide (TPR) repeat protein
MQLDPAVSPPRPDRSVEFRVLGSLEVLAGSKRFDVSGTRQQIVLATLLLSSGSVVSIGRLLEAIYGEDLPPTARSQAQISVSSLRRLFSSRGYDSIIGTRAQGYVVHVDQGQLDCRRFEGLVEAARAAGDAKDLDLAVGACRDALRLWRGPALDGIDSRLIQTAANRLNELRIAMNEDCVEFELDLGRHHGLVGELTELVEKYPLRERLRGQFMLALYRCDRRAEALQVYRQTRQTMIHELGIEPSDRLQQLEYAVLTSDPALGPPAGPVRIRVDRQTVPSLLPADIGDFTGRETEIEELQQRLASRTKGTSLAVPIVAIVGKPGIGKTSVAVHAAHGLAEQYPDGQLFADLHGALGHPVGPMRVLERFLRALGLSGGQMPDGIDERAEVYRDLLAARKVLILLDDAASESQVMPLLPGSDTAAVIVTSRSRLAGLAGATQIDLGVFDAGTSLELLARIAGTERVQSQCEAAAAVATLCGHLPLALRIAGTRLSVRRHWSIEQLVERLADETRRLDELKHGDMGVRATVSLIYDGVSEQARQLFRRLALLDLPAFSGWVSAALMDLPLTQAEDLLDDLVSVQLIEATSTGSGVQSQYRFHDLIGVFARERLAAEESVADRKSAFERALGALLFLAEEAHRRYYGGDYVRVRIEAQRWPLPERLVDRLVGDPLSWFERERTALVSGVRQAAQAGLVELCWSLAFIAVTLFESRTYLDDWRETHDIALEAARKAEHVRGQAAMHYSMGSLLMTLQKIDPARRHLSKAARLFLEVGDDQGVALVTRHIAYTDQLGGMLDQGVKHYEHALAVFRQTGDKIATAYVLHGLAKVKLELNELTEAKELLSDALCLSLAARNSRVEAQVLYRMGEAHLMAGELTSAADSFEQTLAKTRDIGDAIGEAYALQGLGVAKIRQGDFGYAASALQRTLALADTFGLQLPKGQALLGLSELAMANGDPGHASQHAQQAADIFRGIGAPLYEVRATRLLGQAREFSAKKRH